MAQWKVLFWAVLSYLRFPNHKYWVKVVVPFFSELRSEEKKSAHVFVCITRIMLGLDKNQSNQQKVHILRIPNW